MKKLLIICCALGVLINGYTALTTGETISKEDYDPLVDINITIEFTALRALDTIDVGSDPDFFVKLWVNDEEFESPVYNDQLYVYDWWSITTDVPDDQELVEITMELWDKNTIGNSRCDISPSPNNQNQGYSVTLLYSIKTGRWYGDDHIQDSSGYGRVCGCDDGSIYTDENDAELWFTISQNDFDNDTLPYWVETQVYGTDPTVDNTGEDTDTDDLPIEWEHYWGYNPLIWDDHEHVDPDQDSLTNSEEYLVREFGADPFRPDVLLELDYMEESPDGTSSIIPEMSRELLKNPFHRRNIVFHVDSGEYDGGQIIPFDEMTQFDEVQTLYNEYFIHNGDQYWKRGIVHYGLIVYDCTPGGYGFSGDVSPYMGYIPGTNSFVISSKHIEKNDRLILTKTLDYCYGSAIMHEMGHNFGMRWGNPFGCDAQRGKRPWQLGFWLYGNYKSIMNYRYTYKIFDYSDGSHGKRDHDDWEAVDLSYFEIP